MPQTGTAGSTEAGTWTAPAPPGNPLPVPPDVADSAEPEGDAEEPPEAR